WLKKTTGKDYRLLSEAEWEYATRGVTVASVQPRYHFGNAAAELCRYGNHADQSTTFSGKNTACSDGVGESTAEVGRYKPNAFGLYDMHGNVWEWVEDCWNANYQNAPADGSAWTTGDCNFRVVRGGGWVNNPAHVRAANRNRNTINRNNNAGLRVASTITWQRSSVDPCQETAGAGAVKASPGVQLSSRALHDDRVASY
ncbi:MAG: formylglycine-generating enzyme family protein, partial [Hyphomicrobiaceae bacterium]